MNSLSTALSNFPNDLKYYLYLVLFGCFGGISYQLISNQSITINDLIKGAVISAFAGLMAGMASLDVGCSTSVSFLFAGMFGFAGSVGLFLLMKFVAKRLGMDDQSLEAFKPAFIEHSATGAEILAHKMKEGVLTEIEHARILANNVDALLDLLKEEHITGVEFDAIREWVTAIHAEEPHK